MTARIKPYTAETNDDQGALPHVTQRKQMFYVPYYKLCVQSHTFWQSLNLVQANKEENSPFIQKQIAVKRHINVQGLSLFVGN